MKKILVEKIRKVYTSRLLEALSEVDVVDKEGNVLISKDLKVIHKDSGFEYTVSDVVKNSDGDLDIVLRMPDEPRMEPQNSTALLDELDIRLRKYVSDAVSPPEEDDTLFVVDAKDFEKEYEVK